MKRPKAHDLAFEMFIETMMPQLSKLCRSMTRGAALDLLEETIARLWEIGAHEKQLDSPVAYACRVARNLLRARHDEERRLADRSTEAAARRPASAPPPDVAAADREEASLALALFAETARAEDKPMMRGRLWDVGRPSWRHLHRWSPLGFFREPTLTRAELTRLAAGAHRRRSLVDEARRGRDGVRRLMRRGEEP